jgi:hypothetical protein
MAFTQTQVDQFEQSLVDRNGVITAAFGDQAVTFATYEEALAFLGRMKRDVAGGSITRYVATDKDV